MEGLIEQARIGDRKARRELYESLRERIERMARHYALRCGEDACDLRQEAWLVVWESLQTVDTSIGDPRQYLLKRAKWRMLDYIKYNRRRRHDALDGAEDSTYGCAETEAVSSAHCTQFIQGLTARQQAIVQRLLEGDTWREAGERLGCTSANVAYHIRQIQSAYHRYDRERDEETSMATTLETV
ncbi:MAG: sigma-70 family RNA polymerase sigma factor [Armatimonadetes bacterium]|nr:sigma-70 family RNA polymerase sigma factor [Armatimonadota bacterium]